MDDRFVDKTAILTGGSRGIGFAIAEQLVRGGARVVLTGRSQEALDQAVEQLGGPEHALGVAGKADDSEHQATTVGLAIGVFGSADLLVNNAGVNIGMAPLVEIDLDAARKTVEVNTLAPLAWTSLVYNEWMREHGGAIVNTSSMGAVRFAPNKGFYGVTKAMLAHLTAQLAVELAPKVRVNAVAPGLVKTDFAARLLASGEEKLAAAYPLRRLGVPADIASAATFLLSDDASWITGQHLVVDGGLTKRSPVPDSAAAVKQDPARVPQP